MKVLLLGLYGLLVMFPLTLSSRATIFGCDTGGSWQCTTSASPKKRGACPATQMFPTWEACRNHNKQAPTSQPAPARKPAIEADKQLGVVKARPKRATGAPPVKTAPKRAEQPQAAKSRTAAEPPRQPIEPKPPAVETSPQPVEPKAQMAEPSAQPIKPKTQTIELSPQPVKPQIQAVEHSAQFELFAVKNAALVAMRDATAVLATIRSGGLRNAIEATIQSLAESLQASSVETIRAQSTILTDLVAQARSAANEPAAAANNKSTGATAGSGTQDSPTVAGQPHPSAALLPPEKRVALVLGNSAYEYSGELANPRNDAKLVAIMLRELGFVVVEGEDLDRAGMARKVREFVSAQEDANVSLFFYAGHGMQVGGRNYLVPIDAKLEDAAAVDFETIEADKILDYMTGRDKVAIALLDACRDNPLARRLANSPGVSRSVSIGTGLAVPTTVGGGILIDFATAPGEVALDGDGEDSPFTTALLKYLPAKGLEIQQVMTQVKAAVYEATRRRQSPWHNSDLRKAFYLNP